jgi:LPS sulfotransferase NodH
MLEARRFVVLAARRSGSNMLCTILGAHPAVVCHHELFNPRGVFVALERRAAPAPFGGLDARERDPHAFLRDVWRMPGKHACVGFKITPRQMPHDVFDALLADHGIAKIVLRRDNVVRALVSERIAERVDQWEVYDAGSLAVDKPRVRVTADEVQRYAADVDAYYADIAQRLADQPHLTLRYESLAELTTQNRAFDFLDVARVAAPIAARSVRQNPEPLAALIENHAELAAALRGGPLADALED